MTDKKLIKRATKSERERSGPNIGERARQKASEREQMRGAKGRGAGTERGADATKID